MVSVQDEDAAHGPFTGPSRADLDLKLWFGVLPGEGDAAFPIRNRRKPCYRSLIPNI